MSGIRRATPNDLHRLLTLLKDLHAESVFRNIPIDENRLKSFASTCIANPSHIWVVYENAGAQIDGFLLGYVTQYYFSTELGAWDIALYVRPERRGSTIAFRLWRAFKARAAELGARTMWLGSSAGITPALTHKFYTGLGMAESGTLYRLSINREPG
jgi:GNAT superfamily N-acetyltransferase